MLKPPQISKWGGGAERGCNKKYITWYLAQINVIANIHCGPPPHFYKAVSAPGLNAFVEHGACPLPAIQKCPLLGGSSIACSM